MPDPNGADADTDNACDSLEHWEPSLNKVGRRHSAEHGGKKHHGCDRPDPEKEQVQTRHQQGLGQRDGNEHHDRCRPRQTVCGSN